MFERVKMAVSPAMINGYTFFTSVSEQMTAFYTAILSCIIGSIKLADLPDFFLDQPQKML
jgi:hypothetical protein